MTVLTPASRPRVVLSLWKGLIEAPAVPPDDPRPEGGLKRLLNEVARAHGLPLSRLISRSRIRPIAHARQDFMWRARQIKWPDGRWRYSLSQVASILNIEDHTTIIHGVRAHKGRLAAQAIAEAA